MFLDRDGQNTSDQKRGPSSVQRASPTKELRSERVPSCLNHSHRDVHCRVSRSKHFVGLDQVMYFQ